MGHNENNMPHGDLPKAEPATEEKAKKKKMPMGKKIMWVIIGVILFIAAVQAAVADRYAAPMQAILKQATEIQALNGPQPMSVIDSPGLSNTVSPALTVVATPSIFTSTSLSAREWSPASFQS